VGTPSTRYTPGIDVRSGKRCVAVDTLSGHGLGSDGGAPGIRRSRPCRYPRQTLFGVVVAPYAQKLQAPRKRRALQTSSCARLSNYQLGGGALAPINPFFGLCQQRLPGLERERKGGAAPNLKSSAPLAFRCRNPAPSSCPAPSPAPPAAPLSRLQMPPPPGARAPSLPPPPPLPPEPQGMP
jgi:hypothetical protein